MSGERFMTVMSSGSFKDNKMKIVKNIFQILHIQFCISSGL